MLTVYIRGLEFYAYHGVPAEERVIGHRYRVDVELRVTASATMSDQISGTVDYGDVAMFIVKQAQGVQVNTLERLGHLLTELVMDRYPTVNWMKIKIEKPFPPAPIIAEAVGVELERDRFEIE